MISFPFYHFQWKWSMFSFPLHQFVAPIDFLDQKQMRLLPIFSNESDKWLYKSILVAKWHKQSYNDFTFHSFPHTNIDQFNEKIHFESRSCNCVEYFYSITCSSYKSSIIINAPLILNITPICSTKCTTNKWLIAFFLWDGNRMSVATENFIYTLNSNLKIEPPDLKCDLLGHFRQITLISLWIVKDIIVSFSVLKLLLRPNSIQFECLSVSN